MKILAAVQTILEALAFRERATDVKVHALTGTKDGKKTIILTLTIEVE